MPKRFYFILLIFIIACNQATINEPNTTTHSIKAVADTYTFTQDALSLVGKDKGVLINDTLPQSFELKVTQNPKHGSLSLSKVGAFSYQHNGSQASEDSFSYMLSSSGKTSSATVTLTITPKPANAPTANAESYGLDEGATLTVSAAEGVLSNDRNPLNTSLIASILEAPQQGSVALSEDGAFVYIHNHSETTQDSFRYRIGNGQATAEATVMLNIAPVEDTPVINKLELAQTHLIPPQGKSWSSDTLKDYNLHLVGNRDALVLVDIESTNGRIVEAVLEAQVAGQKLGEVVLNSPITLPKTESEGPAYSTTAYWANLDKAWMQPGLELRVRANEGQTSDTTAVNVGADTAFTMYTLPFYLFGLDETDIPLSQTAAPDQATQEEYFAKHPIARLNMMNHPAKKVIWPYIIVAPREGRPAQKVEYKEQQGDGYAVMSAVLNTLGAIRSANGDSSTSNQYYGPLLMANQAGNYSHPGGGLGGGNLGTGDHSYTGIFIHEAGHAFGMPHANDGYNAGSYPYIGGSLKGSGWGYDQIRQEFLGTLVPTNSSRYSGCAGHSFPMGRQFDDDGRCIKQDPMQSGSGDQASGYKYTMFSDFNASVVQKYLEGITTIASNGQRIYSGGKMFVDPDSPTGYSRWDSLDKQFVPYEVKTTEGGLWGLDNGFPVQRDVSVHTLIITIGIDSIHDTTTEATGETHLSYQDILSYNPTLTQIYPPLSYTGNLRRMIDPTNPSELASIVPNTSENYWYCRGSGCDYTLKVTFTDNTEQNVVLQGGFRGWFKSDIKPEAGNPTSGDSYRIFGVNIPGNKPIKKLELLETPEVWKGLPESPKIIATRLIN